ncbi:MAG TPA: DUF1844 domain-containing protein [Chthonomonadales bacterium]|nr:DUF1844 domain-containing protein [Chthonomonadales bacterium]
MAPEEQDDFTVVDKRRTGAADVDSEEPAGPEPSEAAVPEQEGAAEAPPHSLTPRDRLLMCIDILMQGAWVCLGLRADPVTGKVEADLANARVLIDSVDFLAERVRAELDAATQRDLKNAVANLQINFVRIRQQSSS